MLQPMQTFDPTKRCNVHDGLNDCTLQWKPEWASNYHEHAQLFESDTPGVIAWDGMLLDGWAQANAATEKGA